jgi:hypothetical protein
MTVFMALFPVGQLFSGSPRKLKISGSIADPGFSLGHFVGPARQGRQKFVATHRWPICPPVYLTEAGPGGGSPGRLGSIERVELP